LFERSEDGGRSSTASTRSLAAELGLAKNTAHRALASLVRAGLIEAVQSRDRGGRFEAGCYRLHVDGLVDGKPASQRAEQPASQRAKQPAKQPAKNAIQSAQLTLIEAI
jgi:DNA-binding IclR family transcriptional regulator